MAFILTFCVIKQSICWGLETMLLISLLPLFVSISLRNRVLIRLSFLLYAVFWRTGIPIILPKVFKKVIFTQI